jgi:hypothetical protein
MAAKDFRCQRGRIRRTPKLPIEREVELDFSAFSVVLISSAANFLFFRIQASYLQSFVPIASAISGSPRLATNLSPH